MKEECIETDSSYATIVIVVSADCDHVYGDNEWLTWLEDINRQTVD